MKFNGQLKAQYYRVLSVKIEDPTKRHQKEKHLFGVLFHCFQKELVNLQWSFVYKSHGWVLLWKHETDWWWWPSHLVGWQLDFKCYYPQIFPNPLIFFLSFKQEKKFNRIIYVCAWTFESPWTDGGPFKNWEKCVHCEKQWKQSSFHFIPFSKLEWKLRIKKGFNKPNKVWKLRKRTNLFEFAETI